MTSKEKFKKTLNKKLREIKESFMANWKNHTRKVNEPMLFDWTHLGQDPNEYTKGGIRKIADVPPIPCQHPEHNFPGMIALEPGVYEHTCPACGARQLRQVPRVYL